MLRRAALAALTIVVPVLLVLGAMEIVLRLDPTLISLDLLERFPVRLRSEIAGRLNLPTGEDYMRIASAERYDKGPDLLIPRPDVRYPWPVDAADLNAGS